VSLNGLPAVLEFYDDWRTVYEQIDYNP
jgi:hypothetical protein